jgi:polyhydroxyalkanoate synthesis regulator phasin
LVYFGLAEGEPPLADRALADDVAELRQRVTTLEEQVAELRRREC